MARRSTQPLRGRAGRDPRRARRADAGRVPALRGHDPDVPRAAAITSSRSGRNIAPTWMGAIGGAHGGRARRAHAGRDAPSATASSTADEFRRLAFAQPAVHRRVMQQVAPVMSRITAIEQNRERLASLGTMAAGLAHELNNPAAAAGRAAEQMVEAVDVVGATLRPLRRVRDRARGRRASWSRCTPRRSSAPRAARALDALDAADAEDALLERLEALGVPEPWRLAEPLAAAGVDEAWLEQVAALAGPRDRRRARVGGGDAHGAQPRGRAAGGDAADVEPRRRRQVVRLHGSRRRGRGRPPRGPRDDADVLGHRLKHTSIQVVRDYDRSLPQLTVRGSELNQVWTNLLENAIDALGESGTITITTRLDGDCAVGRHRRRRAGHPRGDPRAHLRLVLHDQGRRQRHGPRARDGASHRRRPPRRVADRRIRAGPDGLPRPAPTHADLTEARRMPTCTHLDTFIVTQLPDAVRGCEDCLATGGLWLHLRICLECGHVGCCDDSPNRHASGARTRDRRTRSSARSSRARTGRGASSTRSRCASRTCRARRASRRRPCSVRCGALRLDGEAPARLEAGDLPAARGAHAPRRCRRDGSSSRRRRCRCSRVERRSCSAPQLLQRTSVA